MHVLNTDLKSSVVSPTHPTHAPCLRVSQDPIRLVALQCQAKIDAVPADFLEDGRIIAGGDFAFGGAGEDEIAEHGQTVMRKHLEAQLRAVIRQERTFDFVPSPIVERAIHREQIAETRGIGRAAKFKKERGVNFVKKNGGSSAPTR